MAIQLVTRTIGAGANTFTTPSCDTNTATLLVAVTSIVATSAPAVVSDSNGNTWIALTPKSVSGQHTGQIFYAANPIVGSGHTFTMTGSSIFASMIVGAFSGIVTSSPFDVENGATLAGSGTTLQPGSVTPSVSGALIVSGFGTGAAPATLGSLTLDPDITSIFVQTNKDTVGGVSYGSWAAWGIQQSAAAINPTWTCVNGSGSGLNGTAVIAAFIAAAPSGGGGGAWAFCG